MNISKLCDVSRLVCLTRLSIRTRKQEEKDLKNELRSAQRRRQRLKHKARLLSKADLMEVMMLRTEEEAGKRARTEEDSVEPAPSGPAEGEAGATGHASDAEEENRTP